MNGTLLQAFSTADEQKASFNNDIAAGFTVIFLMAVFLMLFAWIGRRKQYLKPAALLALAGFLIVGWDAYSGSYGRFFEAQVQGSELRLRFAEPLAKDVSLPADSVDTALSGSPGKSNRQCYVRVVLKSGGSYRSATLDKEFAACKKLGQDLLQALKH